MESSESAYHGDYFYVGGNYVDDPNRPGQRVMEAQMYVEQLTPLSGTSRPLPLVFIHGAGQTATNWLNTPDGRKGWASYFVDQGYKVYLIDSPLRGRSSWQASSDALMTVPVSFAEAQWTAPSTHNHWPQSHLHTQWPGSGHPGSPIFSAFYASNVPFLSSTTLSQTLFQNAGTALLDHIGLSILITHSQGGPSGWLLADARPKLVRGIIAIEPAGPPFTNKAIKGVQKPYGIAAIALTYDPPAAEGDTPLQIEIIDETPPGGGEPWKLQTEPARQLVNLADISVVVVTAEASYHAAYDECTVRFLKQAGVMVSWLRLADQGIRGNGHMMFMEKNNLSIAHLLEKHIAMLLLKNPPPSKPTNPPHTSSSTPPKIPADLTPPRDT